MLRFWNDVLLTLILDSHYHSLKERERNVPLDSLISENGRMIVLVLIVAQNVNFSRFVLQSAYEYTHTRTNTALNTCLLVLIREDNDWLLRWLCWLWNIASRCRAEHLKIFLKETSILGMCMVVRKEELTNGKKLLWHTVHGCTAGHLSLFLSLAFSLFSSMPYLFFSPRYRGLKSAVIFNSAHKHRAHDFRQ